MTLRRFLSFFSIVSFVLASTLPRDVLAQSTLPSPWETGDIGTVTTDSKGVYASGVFTLASSRDGIYAPTSTDEFRYVYQTLPGDGEIQARVKTITSDGKSRHSAGVMIRQNLTANSIHASTVVTRGNGVKAFYRTTTGGSTAYKDGASSPSLPYWVRIVRKNSTTFEMYQSSDASGTPAGWTLVKSQIIPDMTGALSIGLVAASGYDGVLTSSDIDGVSIIGALTPTPTPSPTPTPTPSPSPTPTPTPTPTPSLCSNCLPSTWETGDIGTVTTDSQGVYSNTVFTLASSRDGLYSSTSTDEFRYVYQTLPGDGEIQARVTSITSGKSRHDAGVMIRQSLAPDSIHASAVVTRGNEVKAFYRTTTGGSAAYKDGAPNPPLPYWVRVVRKNSTTFEMYQSSDSSGAPSGWTLISSQTISPMTGTLYIGLVAASGYDGVLNSSDIDSVSIIGALTPSPTPVPTPTPTPTPEPSELLLIALEPIVLAPQACPSGIGPGGIRPANYPAEKLTQEQRQWLFTTFGNEGTAPVGYGGERCRDSYDNQNDNFNAMVCSSGQTGPGGIVPGGYNPEQLTQEQRQWLFEVFGNSGIAPVGFGGPRCPDQENNYSVDDIHLANVCSSGALGPYSMKPQAYTPTELNQDERQWLWNMFEGSGEAPVGYGGPRCLGQTQNAPGPDRTLPYNPYQNVSSTSCYSNAPLKTGDIVSTYSDTAVYEQPNLASNLLFSIPAGEQVTIVSGPHCEPNNIWWTLGRSNGQGGFVKENTLLKIFVNNIAPFKVYMSTTADLAGIEGDSATNYTVVASPEEFSAKLVIVVDEDQNVESVLDQVFGNVSQQVKDWWIAVASKNKAYYSTYNTEDMLDVVMAVGLPAPGVAKSVPQLRTVVMRFRSAGALRRFFGPAGIGRNLEHLVEQRAANIKRFGPEAIHNSENVVNVPAELNKMKNVYYSSIQHYTEGLTVREWIERNMTYNQTYKFGIEVLGWFKTSSDKIIPLLP